MPSVRTSTLLLATSLSLSSLACTAELGGDGDTGCEPGSWDSEKEEFSGSFNDISAEFSGQDKPQIFESNKCADDNPKADIFGFLPEPCDLLAPLIPFGDDALKSGFMIGIEGNGILGVANVFQGYDVVWDMYHQQMTVSQYSGGGIATPAAGASVTAYAGAAFGFEHGVADWDGYFAEAEVEIGFPFLQDFLSFNPNVFATAIDDNADGLIAPNEVLAPPDGVYGFTLGLEVGFNLLPEILPISGTVKEGYWSSHKAAIRHFYDEFKDTNMFFTTPMTVALVDHHDGTLCSDNWPEEESERECVIEFGNPSDSYLKRAVNTAYSICHVTGRCAVPLSWPMSATALAIAALRDHDASFASFCPDQATGGAHETETH